ncbi:APC family permease [Catellatospora bangladeshensis]|uniref:Amino acid permease n=1 Tax=Catellatospora bangladeshensis TaxID=310355 RepID=A0A8J3JPK6_9ACTN|nr:APC family permease [Catellatospora bangladeshensis]GIF80979.1 amino acid permease [Catellatospora bangladeshensis]
MSAPPSSALSSALAADRLGSASVASFALTAAAPLMVIGGVIVAGWANVQVIGFPLGILLIGAALALFTFGYVAMSRHIRNAGAFYSYISQGIGRPAGVAAALGAVLAYNLLQVGLYGIFGAAGSGLLAMMFNVEVSWWILALVAWLATTVLGLSRVEINSKLLLVVLVAELAIVLLYDVVFIANPADGVSFAAFSPDNLFVGGALGAVLTVTVTAFVGFEAPPVFAEESRDSKRTIALASFGGLAVMVFVYALTAWALTVATGPDNIVAQAQEHAAQADLMFVLAGEHLGSFFADAGNVLLVTSAFAAMLSYHNTVARYTFSLAREGVLPRSLARTGARSGAPVAASILQSVIGLTVIAVYAIFELDPFTHLFFWLGMTGGFGVLLLLAGTSVAVVFYFAKNKRGESLWTRVIAPVLSALFLIWAVQQTVRDYGTMLAVEEGDPAAWILPGLYLLLAVVGVIWALVLRSSKPALYEAIGKGVEGGRTEVSAPAGERVPV